MQRKPKNFLYTRGYVISRLRADGFAVTRLKADYNTLDKRYWTIVVSKKDKPYSNLFVTCLKESLAQKRGLFIVVTPKATLFHIDTISMEVMSDTLNTLLEADPK